MMGEPIPADEQVNYDTFRECLSEPILRALAAPAEKPKARNKRHVKKASKNEPKTKLEKKNQATKEIPIDAVTTQTTAAEDLGEFIDYLSSLLFPSLPTSVRTLSYAKYKDSTHLQDEYTPPLSQSTSVTLLNTIIPTAIDSLESYALVPTPSDPVDLRNLLLPVLHSYLAAVTAPPPLWSTTRTDACELCSRDWVPLTYHHLIPKSTHKRVRQRAWHSEDMLNSVAWLCRACHSFLHRLAGNEDLAKGFYTLDLIRQGGVQGDNEKRERVEGWVKWVGGVRWKSR